MYSTIKKTSVSELVDKLTGLFLAFYIICTTAFEGNPATSRISSIALYAFLLMGAANILFKKRVVFNFYFWSRAAYLIVMLLVIIFNNYNYASATHSYSVLYWYFTCFVITFLVINYVDSKEKIWFLLKAYAIAGSAICAVVFSYYGLGVFSQAAESINGLRIGSEYGNENGIALSGAFSVIFSLFILLNRKPRLLGILFYSANILACLSLALLAASKKALALIFFGVFFVIVSRGSGREIFKKALYFLLAIIGVLLIYWVLSNINAFWYVFQRVNEMLDTIFKGQGSYSDRVRLDMIKIGLQAFGESPFIGNGVAYSYTQFSTYSHNNYVEILMNTGIVGFIAYYSSYAITLKRMVLNCNRSESLWGIMMLIAASFLLLELGLVDYYTRYFQILLSMVSVYTARLHEKTSRKSRPVSKYIIRAEENTI